MFLDCYLDEDKPWTLIMGILLNNHQDLEMGTYNALKRTCKTVNGWMANHPLEPVLAPDNRNGVSRNCTRYHNYGLLKSGRQIYHGPSDLMMIDRHEMHRNHQIWWKGTNVGMNVYVRRINIKNIYTIRYEEFRNGTTFLRREITTTNPNVFKMSHMQHLDNYITKQKALTMKNHIKHKESRRPLKRVRTQ